jgi:phage regulator Rha-like protein
MLQEYESEGKAILLTCQEDSYIDGNGTEQTMFSMSLDTAFNFIARLKGPRPNAVRDKLVFAFFEFNKRLASEKAGASSFRPLQRLQACAR